MMLVGDFSSSTGRPAETANAASGSSADAFSMVRLRDCQCRPHSVISLRLHNAAQCVLLTTEEQSSGTVIVARGLCIRAAPVDFGEEASLVLLG